MSVTQHTSNTASTGLFALGSLWSLLDAIRQGLPSWNLVPPILFGLAALITAIRSKR